MVSESSGTELVLKPSGREEDQYWVLVKLLSKAGILNPFCAMNVLGFLVKLTDLLGKKTVLKCTNKRMGLQRIPVRPKLLSR